MVETLSLSLTGPYGCLVEYVKKADYDALAAEMSTLRQQAAIFNGRHEADQKRIAALESALQTIGNELDLHGAEGPAGDAFRSCLNPTWDKLETEQKS